ncbi:sensor histidine kinase [Micromonospora sp. NPDC050397]|uniref:sensor histidine kinase n=1 Tax=Micromonospora sp. NPDC050397 TaxID=3364279 RepID=UPI003851793B
MTLRSALAPLVRGTTYRRGVFLLLGGVLLLPYLLLGVLFGTMLTESSAPRGATWIVLTVAVVIAAVPIFLGGSRALEIAAARALLDVELPEPARSGRLDRESRLRAALWIGLHLVSGGLVMWGLITALPMALVFIVQWFGVGSEAMAGARFGPLDEHDTVWFVVAGLALLLGLGYAVAGLGALAAQMAPVLLGPSQTERVAVLEARAARLAERNRLARELHDSVGHALTVATLQAGVARELLDADPEFARRALLAIEQTARAATEDLDQVLGLLRERDGDDERAGRDERVLHGGQVTRDERDRRDGRDERNGQDRRDERDEWDGRAGRDLADLDRLVAETRAAGLPVEIELTGAVDRLPAVISREGYRIVQEGLTNAVRHSGRQRVSVRVGVPAGYLEIEVVNPVSGAADRRRRGRGLAGMRERVLLLGGRMTAGPEDGGWRVSVRLPAGRVDGPIGRVDRPIGRVDRPIGRVDTP